MQARARIFGHPIHHILVVFPLGLLSTSFFFDLAWLATGRDALATAASWMIVAGVIGGLAASLFGVMDWLAIPRGTKAWHMAAFHGGGNTLVAILFAVSWAMRRPDPVHPPALAILLSALGVLSAVITGWVGAEVADRLAEREER